MARLEFPQFLYQRTADGAIDYEKSVRVENAEDAAVQLAKGYVALDHGPAPDSLEGLKQSPDFLPYPRILYRVKDGQPDYEGETARVENAEEEAAAESRGFLSLDAIAEAAAKGTKPAKAPKPSKA